MQLRRYEGVDDEEKEVVEAQRVGKWRDYRQPF